MQEEIDRGLQHCEPCDQFGVLTFCGACGRRFLGAELERRKCPDCKIEVTTAYCPKCGEQIVSEALRRWERGEVDLLEEGRKAMVRLQAMIKTTPRLAVMLYPDRPDLHPPEVANRADIVRMINAGFGRI